MTKNAKELNKDELSVDTVEAQESSKDKSTSKSRPRSITNPSDVAALVLTQLNTVSNKKDELTIAIKGLSDICQQLVYAYSDHTKVIKELKQRLDVLESK